MHINFRKRRRGLTLLESLLAIAIGAAVIVAAIIFYTSAQGNNLTNNAQTQVQGIVANTRSYFAGFGSYIDLGTDASNQEVAVNARIFPSSMIPNGTTSPRNPWNGDVSLVSDATGKSFVLTFQEVPLEACVRLVSQIASSMGASLISTSVGGTNLSSPYTAATVASACRDPNSNTITWTMR